MDDNATQITKCMVTLGEQGVLEMRGRPGRLCILGTPSPLLKWTSISSTLPLRELIGGNNQRRDTIGSYPIQKPQPPKCFIKKKKHNGLDDTSISAACWRWPCPGIIRAAEQPTYKMFSSVLCTCNATNKKQEKTKLLMWVMGFRVQGLSFQIFRKKGYQKPPTQVGLQLKPPLVVQKVKESIVERVGIVGFQKMDIKIVLPLG